MLLVDLAAEHAGVTEPVPPVAPVREIGSAPGDRAERAGAAGWARYSLSCVPGNANEASYIRLSTNDQGTQDMRFVCGFCKFEKNQTCKHGAHGQGRPFAALVNLGQFSCRGDAVQHKALCAANKPDGSTLTKRSELRKHLQNDPLCVLWRSAERLPNAVLDDANGEPFRLPFRE
jgi:hypothetical protein